MKCCGKALPSCFPGRIFPIIRCNPASIQKQIRRMKALLNRRSPFRLPHRLQTMLHQQTKLLPQRRFKPILPNKRIMNSYVGKLCPYCKTELKVTDEIVLCSACRMPHHKECWIANSGCTTFGCMGTIDCPNPRDDFPEESFEILIEGELVIGCVNCPQCAALNSRSNLYCTNCGCCLSK